MIIFRRITMKFAGLNHKIFDKYNISKLLCINYRAQRVTKENRNFINIDTV